MPRYRHWLLDGDGHIARLTLNRPAEENNLTADTLYELREISAYLRSWRDIWVVLLQGQGRHFSTGIDVDMIRARIDQPERENKDFLLELQGCLDDFEALEVPTIAKLHGFCIGGGLILALCCDFRIASRRTVFSLPEVRLGIGVIMGTQRVTRTVGAAAAKEMILLGKRFNAEAARDYGLVHAVVAPEELDGAVDEFAKKFLSLPPRTVGIAKRMINVGQDLPLRESQDLEIESQAEILGSPDMREAIESYQEKRPPRFTGE